MGNVNTAQITLELDRMEMIRKALLKLALDEPAGSYTAKELAAVTGIPYKSTLKLLNDNQWSLVFETTEKRSANNASRWVTSYHIHRYALAEELAFVLRNNKRGN